MKHVLLTAALLCNLALLAQPTYYASDGATTIGSSPVSIVCDWLDPGPAGANQNWDFSAVVPGTSASETVLAPSTTPYYSSFTSANRASGSGTSFRYWTESTGQTVLNGQVSNGAVLVYTNTEKIAQYPLTMNTNWSDPFGGSMTANGITTVRSGTYTGDVDAWGTVVLPSGTFTNTLRLHYQESMTDASPGGTLHYEVDSYAWLKVGFSKSLVAFQSYTISIISGTDTIPFQQQQYGVLDAAAVGMDESESDGPDLVVYPNPTHASAQVGFNAVGNARTTIDIVDLSGNVVRSAWNGVCPPGPRIHQLDVSGLAPALYAVRIQQEGRSPSITRLMVE